MEQNKTRTYLLYAVGEIALVMIGILLALQVNNWNEARKNQDLSKSYIKRLITDLQSDSTEMAANLNLVRFKYQIGKKVHDLNEGASGAFDSPLEAMVAMNMTGSTGLPSLRENTYQDLISTGNIQYITDDKLTDDLLIYYGERRELYKWFDEYIDRAWRSYLPVAVDLQPLDLLEGILRFDRTRNEAIELKEYVAELEFNETDANEIISKLRKRSDFNFQIKNVVRAHLLQIYVLEKQIPLINELINELRTHLTTL